MGSRHVTRSDPGPASLPQLPRTSRPVLQASRPPGTPPFRHALSHTQSHPHTCTGTRTPARLRYALSRPLTLTRTYPITHIHIHTQSHSNSHSRVHTRLLHSLPQLLPHLHILTFTYSEHFCWLNCIPQNSYSPRTSDVTLFGNKLFTDISKVRIEMTLYCIRVNPKSNESPYKRQKRTEEASK